ncbi:MAG: DUF3108 domain-containing protein [Bacteroidales bacterium]|nr:DUF3108 domain-containing protein [Bacteroidales bacterium]
MLTCIASAVKTESFIGETLNFRIRYGFITGGQVRLVTHEGTTFDEPSMHIKVDMFTTGIVDNIYHLHDVYESDLRTYDGLPLRFTRDVHEGKYTTWEQVDYFDNLVRSTTKGDYQVDKRYHDFVSAIYAVRCLDFQKLTVGHYTTIPTYYEEEIRNIRVFYQGKEEIKINGKIYQCHKFAPILNDVEMFEKKAPFTIWISDDDKRKPVFIKVNFKVGSFKVELID